MTGGAGFIGSHTVIQLLEAGYKPVICDLFSNSSIACIDRLEQITGVCVCVCDEFLVTSQPRNSTLFLSRIVELFPVSVYIVGY